VQFPEASAPTDESLARAVINFADALAKGDADKLRPMLDPVGKQVLDQLTASGDWDESTGKSIEAVRVSKLSGSDPASLRLAIQEPGSAYALAWSVRSNEGAFIFAGAPIPNVTFPRASDFDNSPLSVGAAPPAAPAERDPAPDTAAPSPEDGESAPAGGNSAMPPDKRAEPAISKAEPPISKPSEIPNFSSLYVFLRYQIHQQVMIHHSQGAPLPAESVLGLSKSLKASADVIDREIEKGRAEATEHYVLSPQETRLLVDGMLERYEKIVLQIAVDANYLLAQVAKLTGVELEKIKQQYDAGKK
jgi:hypothetical protein